MRKILFGLALSGAGILLTLGWYKFDLARSRMVGEENKKVLARLSFVKNDVQKKQAQRVIWQSLGDSDELHAGEAVRTAADSEAKILFVSGAQIEMDPESVITIEENAGKIDLNFLKGNLLVKNTGGSKGAGNLQLKAGETNIALNNSELALNKGAGQGMNVQVLQGTAEMSSGTNKVTLDKDKSGTVNDKGGMSVTEQFFKIKAPLAFAKVYVRIDKREPVVFEWQALPENFDVYLEVGKTRESLVRMYPKVPGNKGILATQLKVGTSFWRLVAIDTKDPKNTYTTIPGKLTVVAEVPPQLLEPKKDSTVALDQVTKTLPLRWTNPSHLERCHVEISDNAQFSRNIYSESLEDGGVHQAALKQEGVYYWRVAGFRPGSSQEVVSDVQKFVLKTKIQLVAPELKGGVDALRVTLESIQRGAVNLAWEPVMGINQYQVRVFQYDGKTLKPFFEGPVSDVNQIKFMGTKAGTYRWDVASVGADGKMSSPSKPHTVVVEELPSVLWADDKEVGEYFYTSLKPQLKVAFKPFARAAAYKIIHKNEYGEVLEEKLEGRASEKLFNVGAEGTYSVTVEALNDRGLPLARSRTKDFNVKQAPYLPPPEFAAKVPQVILARKSGLAQFAVQPVPGARGYVVLIKRDGKLEKQEKVVGANIALKDLMPGEYKISLATVDAGGRTGPSGKERGLSVPNVSESRAPSFKKVRIK